MGREYVVQTWVKHDENDPRIIPGELIDTSTGYSGEQIGNRLAKSHGNEKQRSTMPGWNTDGSADLTYYGDEKKSGIVKNPLLAVDPAFKTLIEYETKIKNLETALADKTITKSLYDIAINILDIKHEKASQKLEKLLAENNTDDSIEDIPVIIPFDAETVTESITDEEKEIALNRYYSYRQT